MAKTILLFDIKFATVTLTIKLESGVLHLTRRLIKVKKCTNVFYNPLKDVKVMAQTRNIFKNATMTFPFGLRSWGFMRGTC